MEFARELVGEGDVAGGFKPTRKCLVILPTYEECQNLLRMVEAIRDRLRTDILVVDDNSPDGTGDLADLLAARHDYVHVLHRSAKLGLGTAYLAGFDWGLTRDYERLIQMDCDFSHDPSDLPRMVSASEDVDLVIGSRYVAGGSTAGWSFRRRTLSRAANLYARVFLGRSIADWTAGYRCFSRRVLADTDLHRITARGFAFQIQMAFAVRRAGGVIREIPVRFVDRNLGESKMEVGICAEALTVVPTLRLGAFWGVGS